MKKFLYATLLFALCCMPFTVSAIDIVVTGVNEGTLQAKVDVARGGNAYTSITSLKISGNKINDVDFEFIRYSLLDLQVLDLEGLATLISIPDGAMGIEGSQPNTTLITVKLSSRITSIGDNAFFGCTALENIDVSFATSIGNYAFRACLALESIDVKSAITIGRNAFSYCTALKNIDVKSAITIGMNAFSECTALEIIDVRSATNIEWSAFENCSALKSIDISSITSIDDGTFAGCTALENIKFGGAQAPVIGNQCFDGIPLNVVAWIPATWNSTTPNYNNLVAAWQPRNILVGMPVLVSGVTNTKFKERLDIARGSMATNTITHLIVSGTGMNAMDFHYIKTSLAALQFIDLGGLNALTVIPSNAFNNKTTLTTVKLSSSITHILDNAFSGCTALENIDISSVTNIGIYAFSGCNNLQNIQFGGLQAPILESTCFTNVSANAIAWIPENWNSSTPNYATLQAAWQPRHISNGAISVNNVTVGNLKNKIDEVLGSNVVSRYQYVRQLNINGTAINATDFDFIKNNLISLRILALDELSTLTVIPDNALYISSDCPNVILTTVKLPSGVRTISSYSFAYCEALIHINANNVVNIANYAFYNCKALTNINISKTTSIGKSAFHYCSALATLKIGGKQAPQLSGGSYFNDVLMNATVWVPANWTDATAYYGTFKTAWGSRIIKTYDLQLDKEELRLDTQKSGQLQPTLTPNGDPFDKTVYWQSRNSEIAAVNANGKVTAGIMGGECYVVATYGGVSDSCKIIVTQQVTDISLNMKELTLRIGNSRRLTATVTPTNAVNKTITWFSRNPAIATVENGTVKGIKDGVTYVLATAYSGIKDSCKVRIGSPIEAMMFDRPTVSMASGNSEKLVLYIYPENASYEGLIWESDKPQEIPVDNQGIVSSAEGYEGEAVITVYSYDRSLSATCRVVVTDQVYQIDIEPKISLSVGQTRQLTPTVESVSSYSFAWSSEEETIASVDDYGNVTAHRSGSTFIYAEYNGQVASCEVSVKQRITGTVKGIDGSLVVEGDLRAYRTWMVRGKRINVGIPEIVDIVNGQFTCDLDAGTYYFQAISKEWKHIPGYYSYLDENNLSSSLKWDQSVPVVVPAVTPSIDIVLDITASTNVSGTDIIIKGQINEKEETGTTGEKSIMARPVAYATVILYGKSKSKSAGQSGADADGFEELRPLYCDDNGDFVLQDLHKDYLYKLHIEMAGYKFEHLLAINETEAERKMTYNVNALAEYVDDVGIITATVTATPTENGSTSAGDREIAEAKLYPNPAMDKLHIEANAAGSYIIKIYNTLGQLVMATNGISPETILDISHLQPGLYFVRIEAGGKMGTYKLIKNRE